MTVSAWTVSWAALLPGAVLAVGALVVLVAELALPPGRARRLSFALTVATLAAAAVSLYLPGQPGAAATPGAAAVAEGEPALVPGLPTHEGVLAGDGLGRLVYGVAILAAGASVAMAHRETDLEPAAFLSLLLLAAAGAGLLASAVTLPGIFLALELLSLGLYVLVSYHRQDPAAQEGAFKYFVLGSFASGLLLFGMALVYGATGHWNLGAISAMAAGMPGAAADGVAAVAGSPGLLVGGFALLLVGLAFKLALVPFHVWAPDAYQGAGMGITAFMAVATKAAALAALIRVALSAPATALGPLWALAAASMLVGSLGALRQQDFRRFMAYSGIANAGYLLMALPGWSPDGIAAAAFYLVAYALTALGLFAVAARLQRRQTARLCLADFQGVLRREPVAGWAAVLFLLSLTGIPISAGFVGKVFLIGAALDGGATWLVWVLVASTAVLAFPYLRLAQIMAQRPATQKSGESPDGMWPRAMPELALVILLCAAGVLWLGVWPGPLLDAARQLLTVM